MYLSGLCIRNFKADDELIQFDENKRRYITKNQILMKAMVAVGKNFSGNRQSLKSGINTKSGSPEFANRKSKYRLQCATFLQQSKPI
jgi:hypothetical protein